jgi:hypothetical protein
MAACICKAQAIVGVCGAVSPLLRDGEPLDIATSSQPDGSEVEGNYTCLNAITGASYASNNNPKDRSRIHSESVVPAAVKGAASAATQEYAGHSTAAKTQQPGRRQPNGLEVANLPVAVLPAILAFVVEHVLPGAGELASIFAEHFVPLCAAEVAAAVQRVTADSSKTHEWMMVRCVSAALLFKRWAGSIAYTAKFEGST